MKKRVRSFGIISQWIRISDPRSSWCIKGIDESTLDKDSLVPLMHHLGSLILIRINPKERTQRFAVVLRTGLQLPFTLQIGVRETNHNRAFCYRYNTVRNWHAVNQSESTILLMMGLKISSLYLQDLCSAWQLFLHCYTVVSLKKARGVVISVFHFDEHSNITSVLLNSFRFFGDNLKQNN